MPKKSGYSRSVDPEQEEIVKIWKRIRYQRDKEEHTALVDLLKSNLNLVSTQNRYQRSQKVLPRLPKRYSVKDESRRKVEAVRLVGAEKAVPPHTARLHAVQSYPAEDAANLDFVPSAVGDADGDPRTQEYFELFDTEKREREISEGPGFYAKAINDDVMATIKEYRQLKRQNPASEDTVLEILKDLARLEDVRAKKLYQLATESLLAENGAKDSKKTGSPPRRKQEASAAAAATPRRKDEPAADVASPCIIKQEAVSTATNTTANGDNKDDMEVESDKVFKKGEKVEGPLAAEFYRPVAEPTIAADVPEYLKMVDSYRKLYCNRCKIYDCVVHGLIEKPSTQLSYELGMEMERPNRRSFRKYETMEEEQIKMAQLVPHDFDPFVELEATNPELDDFQKALCKRLYLIYEGDVNRIAHLLQAPRSVVSRYVGNQNWQAHPKITLLSAAKEDPSLSYHSLRNYDQRWYNRAMKDGLRPAYEPCVHDQPCSETNCVCVKRRIFCTNACSWAWRSRNFFRGCDCRGACDSANCSCQANSRECNPDICRCDVCTDPPFQRVVLQRCRNDNISMMRGTEILLGRSPIPNAGWGAFAKRDIKKGDFIGEYVGEMISQEEADRRGQLYDIRNHSSLFMLSADVALDAERRGNLVRYINHSSAPNTTPKTITVNGDNRIGFFALQDIPAQTELTFHYGYNFSVDNDFVLKSAKAVPWMECEPTEVQEGSRLHDAKGKGKKKAPPNSANNNNANSNKQKNNKSQPSKQPAVANNKPVAAGVKRKRKSKQSNNGEDSDFES